MRRRTGGVWEIFLPDVALGSALQVRAARTDGGELLPLKADPFAFACERPPATASIVADPPAGRRGTTARGWHAREAASRRDAPIAIYEVHLGSWRRGRRAIAS